MTKWSDGELEDLFPEADLRHAAKLISRASELNVRPDPAFRSELRRTLIREAWTLADRPPRFWRRILAGPRLAWAGAAVGVALMAVVAVSFATSRPGQIEKVTFGSPIADAQQVSLVEPIVLNFTAAMDQQSVERSITISPATQVTYQWTSATTLQITPVSGDLAPNTQYQLRIAATAATVTHQPLAKPQMIVFTTQPAPAPSPKPQPSVSPQPALGAQRQLAQLPDGPIWFQAAPDSSGIYFLGQGGSINLVPVAGGPVLALVPDGASAPSLSPDGTQIAYVRDGRTQAVSTRDGKSSDLTGPGRVVGWQGQKPLFQAADGSILAGTPPVKVGGPIPQGGAVVSVSPSGDKLVYQVTHSLHLYEIATGKDVAVGAPGATFGGWSQDGKRAVYSGAGGLESADLSGQPPSRLNPAPDGTTWPSRGQVYQVAGANLVSLSPDGTLYRTIAAVDFQLPLDGLADGSGLSFVRGGALWFVKLPGPTPSGPSLDDGNRLVSDFMKARIAHDRPGAEGFLDASGKAGYSGATLSLLGTDDPKLSRWFNIYSEAGAGQSLRYLIRLVTAHADGRDAGYIDEVLVVRPVDSKLVIDRASGGAVRPAGQGPEIIAVLVSGAQIQVSFDSDLDQSALARGFAVSEIASGKALAAQPTYDAGGRMVRLAVTGLVPGAQYRLSVQAGLKDVSGRPLAAEFDVDITAP